MNIFFSFLEFLAIFLVSHDVINFLSTATTRTAPPTAAATEIATTTTNLHVQKGLSSVLFIKNLEIFGK